MTEKISTPEDSIHNLCIVIEALEAEGLQCHVSLVEDGIWQIERLSNAAWQPIDTAPDKETILFWYAGSEYEKEGYKIGRMDYYGGQRIPVCNATIYSNSIEAFKGWHPLPKPMTLPSTQREGDQS
jgi:hypothetical protein